MSRGATISIGTLYIGPYFHQTIFYLFILDHIFIRQNLSLQTVFGPGRHDLNWPIKELSILHILQFIVILGHDPIYHKDTKKT